MTRMPAVMTFVASVLFFGAGAAIAGQAPPRDDAPNAQGTGTIKGVVTTTDTGQPIRGVEVRLTGGTQRNQQPFGAMTDEAGRYEITGLPAASYVVTASKAGYVTLAYGQTRPIDVGKPVEVAAAAVVDKVDLALPRGAVIVVKIADEYGDPAPGYRVTALQPRFTDGRRTLAALTADTQYVTDDRGELRLSGLTPGDYYVTATPPGLGNVSQNPRAKEPNTFYPGTASEAEAQPVSVALGEEIGITFPLASARAARISGVIERMPQRPPEVRMMRQTPGGNTMLSLNVAPDGTFNASNLAPAEYVITVRGETEAGMLRVRGRYTFDAKPPVSPASLAASLRPVVTDGGIVVLQSVAQVKNDWTFEIPYAFGSGVLRFDQQPRGWFLKAILGDGVDVIDTPMEFNVLSGKSIDVRLTEQMTRVAGTVSDSRGARANTYVAVVFPEDAKQWTPYSRGILAARPDQQGGYVIQGVPPGRYLIAVVDYLEPGAERDPATLQRLRRGAMAVTLGEGEARTIDLKLTP